MADVTTTKTCTLQQVLTESNITDLAGALKKVGGKRHAVIYVLASSQAALDPGGDGVVDITSAAFKANCQQIAGIDALADGEMLPAIGQILSLRVIVQQPLKSETAGLLKAEKAAAAGVRTISDDDDEPTAYSALISGDGTTLTFEGGLTDLILQYIPRSETAMTDEFAPSV